MSARTYVQLWRTPVLRGQLSRLRDVDLGLWTRLLTLANGWYMPGYLVDKKTFAPLSQTRLCKETGKERKPMHNALKRLQEAGVLARRDVGGLRFYYLPKFDKHQKQSKRRRIGAESMDRLFQQIGSHLADGGVSRPGPLTPGSAAKEELQAIVKQWFKEEGFQRQGGETRSERAPKRSRAGRRSRGEGVQIGGATFRKASSR